MDILDHMDLLLAKAAEQGREPLHLVLRQNDWIEIGHRFRQDLLPDPSAVGANTYKGVPIHFAALGNEAIVGLVDRNGQPVE